MVSYGNVRRWKPDGLHDAVDVIKSEIKKIETAAETFDRVRNPAGWAGQAAEAARQKHRKLSEEGEDLTATYSALRRAYSDAANAVHGLRNAIEEADELARRHHFHIDDAGTVHDQGMPPDVPRNQIEAVKEERKRLQAELVERVKAVVRRATDVDTDFAAVLRNAANARIDDKGATTTAQAAHAGAAQGGLSMLAPPSGSGATVAANAAWWDTLSRHEQQTIIDRNPSWIGSRDGIPIVDRHAANKTILKNEVRNLTNQWEKLREKLDGLDRHDLDEYYDYHDVKAELENVEGKLNGLREVSERVDSAANDNASPEDKNYLLKISAGEDGKVIMAKGNPDTADNVATYVPGTGGSLAHIGADLERGDTMQAVAEQADRNAATSVITWMDYDAPDAIPNATSGDYADGAKKDLDSFQDGLRETHQGEPSRNTMIGHSYGSTAIGYAARDEKLDVDQMVMLGSPGVGVDHARDLHIPPENVYASAAEHDIIRPFNVHGTPPDSTAFGGTTFDSDPGSPAHPIDTHSRYFDIDNKAMDGTGKIITGQEPR